MAWGWGLVRGPVPFIYFQQEALLRESGAYLAGHLESTAKSEQVCSPNPVTVGLADGQSPSIPDEGLKLTQVWCARVRSLGCFSLLTGVELYVAPID